ncbi:MAG: hypothetical protein K8963_06750, partial [Proteobacteria bacterium]|nr:hypothetical protein [Pseudomonadota bacterium]
MAGDNGAHYSAGNRAPHTAGTGVYWGWVNTAVSAENSPVRAPVIRRRAFWCMLIDGRGYSGGSSSADGEIVV